uniref:hypothetical protein n=1 Tax=Alistipes shahii TaxID=328814 RepID=UPI003079FA77
STRAGGCSREKRHADGFGTFAIKSTEKAATMSRVFCTFFPQKGTQKLPGRCLRIQRAVLTLASGARLKAGFRGLRKHS